MRADEETCTRIAQRLERPAGIDIATDGGVLFETGAFAWVFDLEENVVLRYSRNTVVVYTFGTKLLIPIKKSFVFNLM
jgi:hypothetical protein